MANINEILAALQNLPRAYNAPPITPTFTGAPLPAGLPNVPLAPVGQPNVPQYGGPSQVTEPPQAPFDPTILAQFLALQGPAPVAPAAPSRGQRIANALIGFGAGVQGNGPQFLEQLQQPQREYQRQLQQYNNNRSELALTGLQAGRRDQEAKTRRAQELSDREFEAELKRETRRLNLSDDRERQLLADALLSRRQREDDERAAKLAEQKDRAAKETQRNEIYAKLIKDDYAPQGVAGEIADNIVHGKPLSKAAEKWRSVKAQKAEAQLARLNGASGGGGTGPVMARLANGQVVPLSQVDNQAGQVILNGEGVPVVGYVGGKIPAQPQGQAAPQLPASPYFNMGNEPAAPAGGKTITVADVRRYAAKARIKPYEAAQQFKDEGYTIKQK